MNIAFLTGKFSNTGGISRVVSILCKKLAGHSGFNIHVIGYELSSIPEPGMENNIAFFHLLESPTPMKTGIFKAGKKLRKYLSDNKIDVLVSCGEIVGPLGVLSTRFNRTKLIYWSHSSLKANYQIQYGWLNEQFSSLFCHQLVCLTKHDKKNYEKDTWAKKVIQIYNPLDPELLDKSFTLKKDTKKIISIGRLTDQKNFQLLVEVAKIVFREKTDWEWHIFGEGPEEQTLRDKIESSDLQEKVLLKGHVNDLYKHYPEYQIMVMTSRYEGFPMSLLEGMATRTPLVSFDIPTGPNETIVNEKNGFLITPFNIDQMAGKVIELINKPEMRQQMGKKHGEYMKEFTIDRIVDKWKLVFQNCQ